MKDPVESPSLLTYPSTFQSKPSSSFHLLYIEEQRLFNVYLRIHSYVSIVNQTIVMKGRHISQLSSAARRHLPKLTCPSIGFQASNESARFNSIIIDRSVHNFYLHFKCPYILTYNIYIYIIQTVIVHICCFTAIKNICVTTYHTTTRLFYFYIYY